MNEKQLESQERNKSMIEKEAAFGTVMEGKEDEQGGAQGRPRARGMPARAAEGGGTRRRVSRMARSPLNGGCSLFT